MATTKFAINVRKWAQVVAKFNLEQTVRGATLEVFGSVVRKSPVDTGRFKGNWQIDQRGFQYDKFDKDGQATLDLITAKVSQSEVGGIVSLINSLPYAERLEFGYSDQAPQGMVRLTAMEFEEATKSAAAKVRK